MEFETDCNDYNYYLSYSDNTEIKDMLVFDSKNFNYNDFFEKCMVVNAPCIIKSITNQWEASDLWVKEGKPDFDYLSRKYGPSNVTIYNCKERYYNSQKTRDSTFDEYLNYWKNIQVEDGAKSVEYLKDWHMKLHHKNDSFYNVPIYFASDWLNEYYSECLDDDYRFVYMGPKGTWTPFHADVFASYSWSANVCGKKRWIFFPPGEENFLRDTLGNLPYDVTEVNHNRKFFDVEQNPGEAIFVPSGWHHQVWNLEDTISINHNWVNACNIKVMWNSMKHNLELICKEIEDCKEMDDFEEHCQIMLNASFGMNFYKFYDFIRYIAEMRIEMLEGKKSRVLFHGHTIGQNHILVDLRAVKDVLEILANCEAVNCLSYFKNDVDVTELLDKLVHILDNK
ncbi:hypothetical protein NQ317_014660 [Molorchus minor]|uniref:Jumonji domain-containing protein 4 n=1 Tax=Molorchus minor TaxID=1323400 RepID=A0ABQ9JAM6_9CUCU|nr:hypothetical protein NQ317_014660 [Molorchus minor]